MEAYPPDGPQISPPQGSQNFSARAVRVERSISRAKLRLLRALRLENFCALLPEDEVRRLPLDEIIMVVDAQMPVRAKRIQYFDDRLFAAIHGAQKGELPFPVMGGGDEGGPGSGDCASNGTKSRPEVGTTVVPRDEAIAGKEVGGLAPPPRLPKKTATVVQTIVTGERRQLEMNFVEQVVRALTEIDSAESEKLAGAVDELDDLETSLERGEKHY